MTKIKRRIRNVDAVTDNARTGERKEQKNYHFEPLGVPPSCDSVPYIRNKGNRWIRVTFVLIETGTSNLAIRLLWSCKMAFRIL